MKTEEEHNFMILNRINPIADKEYLKKSYEEYLKNNNDK